MKKSHLMHWLHVDHLFIRTTPHRWDFVRKCGVSVREGTQKVIINPVLDETTSRKPHTDTLLTAVCVTFMGGVTPPLKSTLVISCASSTVKFHFVIQKYTECAIWLLLAYIAKVLCSPWLSFPNTHTHKKKIVCSFCHCDSRCDSRISITFSNRFKGRRAGSAFSFLSVLSTGLP